MPFFYISLRFLCKMERRWSDVQFRVNQLTEEEVEELKGPRGNLQVGK